MACEVKWTESARNDVDRAIRYIATVLASPKAASEHLDSFEAAAHFISEFPELHAVGKHPSLAARGLRPYFVKNYVMLYSYDGESVLVHRVFHMLQDYARIIGRENDDR